MPWKALAFLAGILWVETRPSLTLAALLGSPLPQFLAGLVAGVAASPALRHRARLFLSLFAITVAGGIWTASRASLLLDAQLDARLEGNDLVIVGTIDSLPETDGARVQFDVALDDGRRSGLPARARLTWHRPEHVPRAGERWQLQVRLRQRRGFANPGNLDYEGQLFRAGVGATGWVRASSANRLLARADGSTLLLRLRESAALRMRDVLSDSPASGVLSGLAVGATAGISPTQWQVFSATGTTHLIAISGMHVTMIAAIAIWLSRVGWRHWPGRPRWVREDVASLLGLLAATAYALLAGMSVPTQRTLLMLLIALGANWMRRARRPSHVLSLALIAVLLLDPHAALTAGFWLSFVAVAAILAAMEGAAHRRGRIAEFLRTQAAVTTVLLPVTLALFGNVSLIAPLANLLAIPLFTLLLVPATLLSLCLLSLLPPVGEGLLKLTAQAFETAWPAFEYAANLPGALYFPAPPEWLLLIAMAVSAIAAMTVLPARVAALGLLLLVPLVFHRAETPAEGGFALTVLDVGQGLAIVVQTRTHTLLYDAGPLFRSGRSAGELAVVPYLHHRGVRRLDRLIVSHDDSDHSGGVPAVKGALPIVDASPCRRGERWNWDSVRLEFLHPDDERPWSGNEGSCVLLIAGRSGAALLTGDIERAGEEWLVSHGRVPRVDVVVLPHHGSRTSSTPALVRAVSARLAIASTGYRNRWQLPHADVIERWCLAGARVLDTAARGAVRIEVSATAGMGEPSAYRAQYQRYWRALAGDEACASRGARPAGFRVGRSLQYHPRASRLARNRTRNVGNLPEGRSFHVAAAGLLHRRGRDRLRAAVDAAGEAGDSARAHRAGVEVAGRQPGH